MKMLTAPIQRIESGEIDLVNFVLCALEEKGRIPFKSPELAYPAQFTRDNIADFCVEQRKGGWVANIVFDVPKGQPDVIGTPDADPFASFQDAFMAGASILCHVVTGSPELPFFQAGDKLMCAFYGRTGS